MSNFAQNRFIECNDLSSLSSAFIHPSSASCLLSEVHPFLMTPDERNTFLLPTHRTFQILQMTISSNHQQVVIVG